MTGARKEQQSEWPPNPAVEQNANSRNFSVISERRDLKSVSKDSASRSRRGTENTVVFRKRIENLSRLAVELTTKLEELKLFNMLAPSSMVEGGIDFYEEVRAFEISLIKRAMQCTGGSQTKAANLLKLNATTLNSKIRDYKNDSRIVW